jgi:divalent metal cation (Fe/Co/Zn/Cd) transporter
VSDRSPAAVLVTPPRSFDPAERARLARRARLLAWAGNAWHVAEFAVAVAAGVAAGSIALVGFGIDSLIEVLAGSVVVWLFSAGRGHSELAERRAQRLIGGTFFLLAAYVTVEAVRTLTGSHHPETSWPGIALAAVTAPSMPLLARAKRRIGLRLGSAAAVSESAQNLLCAYLSVALLVGLGLNAAFGWWWADPLAGLAIAAMAAREGVHAWRGQGCADGCC